MKPSAEFIRGADWNTEGELVDIACVALVPSHKDGYFVIGHEHYGKIEVGKIALYGATQEDIDSMHTTGDFPLDKYITTDAEGKSTVLLGDAEVILPIDEGTNTSVDVGIDCFREYAPDMVAVPVTNVV